MVHRLENHMKPGEIHTEVKAATDAYRAATRAFAADPTDFSPVLTARRRLEAAQTALEALRGVEMAQRELREAGAVEARRIHLDTALAEVESGSKAALANLTDVISAFLTSADRLGQAMDNLEGLRLPLRAVGLRLDEFSSVADRLPNRAGVMSCIKLMLSQRGMADLPDMVGVQGPHSLTLEMLTDEWADAAERAIDRLRDLVDAKRELA